MSIPNYHPKTPCCCFGDSGLQASTYHDRDDVERCDLCSGIVGKPTCSQATSLRLFWGMMGLAYVVIGLAIYGTLTERLSPLVNWPLMLIGIALIAAATSHFRRCW
jgi:hypothetical protein